MQDQNCQQGGEKIMALFIQNLNLPKGCGDCLFTRIDDYCEPLCSIEPRLLIDGYSYIRHPDCPLVEVTIGIDLAKGEGE